MTMALHESHRIVMGAAPAASSTSDYVSLKNYGHVTAIAILDNATTVTGSDLVATQATAVAGTSAKAIDVVTVWQNIDTGAADLLAALAVTAGAWTTDSTNAKNLLYVVEVDADDMDVAGGFDCFSLTNASGVSTVIGIVYILGAPRYTAVAADQPVAITD